jgi:hypothetical protein
VCAAICTTKEVWWLFFGSKKKWWGKSTPGMTPDGTINEALQRKSIEHIIDRVGIKEPPALDRVFDFAITRKANSELRAKGWKP